MSVVIRRAILIGVPTVAALLGCGSWASGSSLIGDESESTGQTGAGFTAAAAYAFQGGNLGLITIVITNDTAPAIGGYLTGFLFNIDSSDPEFALSLMSAPSIYWLDAAGSDALPFGGPYMGGAATFGSWNGTGPADVGLAAGATGVFEFEFEASDAAQLTDMDIGVGPFDRDFVARFRGLSGGRTDKVPAGPPSHEVPGPGAALIGALAGGLLLQRRRRAH